MPKPVYIAAALVAAAAFAGCASTPPPPIRAADPVQPAERRMPLQPDPQMTAGADRDLALAYIDATLDVIGSPAFAANLAGIGEDLGPIWLSPFGGTLSSEQVAAAYLGHVAAHRAVDSRLRWGSDWEAVANWTPDPGYVSIEIGRRHGERWASGNVVARSCAVNTLAHELAHTIPQAQGSFRYLFTDGKRWWATLRKRSLASYTIGAVAQCTYLDQHGARTDDSFPACVRRWGRNRFLSGACG